MCDVISYSSFDTTLLCPAACQPSLCPVHTAFAVRCCIAAKLFVLDNLFGPMNGLSPHLALKWDGCQQPVKCTLPVCCDNDDLVIQLIRVADLALQQYQQDHMHHMRAANSVSLPPWVALQRQATG
jgi:hypothetical protein